MNLYQYIYPVAYNKPDTKCIIYIDNTILYCGNVGDIPMKYGKYIYQRVLLDENGVLRIFVEKMKN
ncbi:MAG: hypothetical protein IJ094_12865 [Bacilli bacterium]|nr:hypothetical protein [Bacilli bacterium]